jgi:hypothetical protein
MNDLYPQVDIPERPTWEDLERLSLNFPFVRDAVTLVARGDLTREEALLRLAFATTAAWQRLFQAEVERLRREPTKPFVITQEPPE